MKEVLLDTETTGLSSVNDKIIEIACIEIEDHIPTGEKFHVFLNPEMEISQGAYDTHGISKEFLRDKPKFNDVAKDFIKFIDGKKLVIHNAEFDLAFLNKELKEVGEKQISKDNIVDTLNVAREKFPGQQSTGCFTRNICCSRICGLRRPQKLCVRDVSNHCARFDQLLLKPDLDKSV